MAGARAPQGDAAARSGCRVNQDGLGVGPLDLPDQLVKSFQEPGSIPSPKGRRAPADEPFGAKIDHEVTRGEGTANVGGREKLAGRSENTGAALDAQRGQGDIGRYHDVIL